jgi:hypothetical protein
MGLIVGRQPQQWCRHQPHYWEEAAVNGLLASVEVTNWIRRRAWP